MTALAGYGRSGGLAELAQMAEERRMDAVRALEAKVPHLRGLLHAVACPLLLGAGVLLAISAHTTRASLAILLMTVGYASIFGTSGAYHRMSWSPSARRKVRQLDHCMIFIGMAMAYSALWVGVLDGLLADAMLVFVWAGTAVGVLAKLRYIDASPSRHWAAYITFGMVGLVVVPSLLHVMGTTSVLLLLAGAAAIALGSVAFVTGRPNPFPRLAGHHEIFHLGTVIGAVLHVAAIATYVLN